MNVFGLGLNGAGYKQYEFAMSNILEIKIHAYHLWSEISQRILTSLQPKHTQILISYGWEANALVNWDWDATRHVYIFEALHKVIAQTGLPYSMFHFCSGNVFISECYDNWRALTNQPNRLASVFHSYSDFFAKIMEVKSTRPFVDFYSMCKKKLKPKYFSCLNARPNTSRVNTLLNLYDHNLLDRGMCTFIFDAPLIQKIAENRPEVAALLPLSLEQQGNFVDYQQRGSSYWFRDEAMFYQVYANSYYDLVLETIHHLDIDATGYPTTDMIRSNFISTPGWTKNVFFTEKLVRNLFNKRPFLVCGGHHSLRVLHQLGFQTFNGLLFNESYDNISDPIERLNAVLSENLRVVTGHSLTDLHKIVYSTQMEKILEHNYQLAVKYSEMSSSQILLRNNLTNLRKKYIV
jgi:hypothetical protein